MKFGADRPQDRPIEVQSELPKQILALFQQKKHIGLLFNGHGTPEIGFDGRPLDSSSVGYDASLVIALVRAGLRDASMLASAVWHRPDGAAKAKGLPYIESIVRNALELASASASVSTGSGAALGIERVRIFTSNPASFEFTVEGVVFVVTSAQLQSPSRFAVAFLDALHRVPPIPRKHELWDPFVTDLLARAEKVELPPDASHTPALREAVERVISALPLGDAPEDLDQSKAVARADGRRAFKVDGLLRLLRDEWPEVERSELCRVLTGLGYESRTERVAGMAVRVWVRNGEAPDTREGAA
jgi:hypothetical protein